MFIKTINDEFLNSRYITKILIVKAPSNIYTVIAVIKGYSHTIDYYENKQIAKQKLMEILTKIDR